MSCLCAMPCDVLQCQVAVMSHCVLQCSSVVTVCHLVIAYIGAVLGQCCSALVCLVLCFSTLPLYFTLAPTFVQCFAQCISVAHLYHALSTRLVCHALVKAVCSRIFAILCLVLALCFHPGHCTMSLWCKVVTCRFGYDMVVCICASFLHPCSCATMPL